MAMMSDQYSSDVVFLLSYADFLSSEKIERISFREHSYFCLSQRVRPIWGVLTCSICTVVRDGWMYLCITYVQPSLYFTTHLAPSMSGESILLLLCSNKLNSIIFSFAAIT